MPTPGVLFDLDGTLLDTLNDLAASGNEVRVARGYPAHEVERYKTFIGNGMRHLVCAIFPDDPPQKDAEIDEILSEYRDAYGRNWTKTTEPYPGIAELLDELTALAIPMGVVSNKAHDFTQRCVDTFLSKWNWSSVLGHRDGAEKKPHPQGALECAQAMGIDPNHCYFVGDSDVDMQTANHARMQAIGVKWGFRSEKELRDAGAKEILSRPQDLLRLLSQ